MTRTLLVVLFVFLLPVTVSGEHGGSPLAGLPGAPPPPSVQAKTILAATLCRLGQAVSSGCTCPASMSVVNGRCSGSGSGSRRLQQCAPPMKLIRGRCQLAPRPNCKAGQRMGALLCVCRSPLRVVAGVCRSVPDCSPGQRVSSPCTCRSPNTVKNGICYATARAVRPRCKTGERHTARCDCVPPLKVRNGICVAG